MDQARWQAVSRSVRCRFGSRSEGAHTLKTDESDATQGQQLSTICDKVFALTLMYHFACKFDSAHAEQVRDSCVVDDNADHHHDSTPRRCMRCFGRSSATQGPRRCSHGGRFHSFLT